MPGALTGLGAAVQRTLDFLPVTDSAKAQSLWGFVGNHAVRAYNKLANTSERKTICI